MKIFSKKNLIIHCNNCNLIFNKFDLNQQKKIENIYTSLKYSASDLMGQTYLTPDNKLVSRSFIQAEIVSKYLTSNVNPAILDIGCFNGLLLREMYNRFPKAILHGFDVNIHLDDTFPKEYNFNFWSSKLENISLQFDLICFSFSIMYFKNIKKLFSILKNLIKKTGKIFIQIPDISKNPYCILLGDQFYYFTEMNLQYLFSKIGFKTTKINSDYFPRDILLIAEKNNHKFTHHNKTEQILFDSLQKIKTNETALKSNNSFDKAAVLGTTVSGAFVDSVIGNKNLFFVDENENRINKNFREKKVIHPSNLDPDITLIIPYGESNIKIKDRFSNYFNINQFYLL